MLSEVLNPVFSPILRPIGNYLRAEPENDKHLTSLKAELKNKIDNIDKVNNPTLHKQLLQLQKDVDLLDLTRNYLSFQEDRGDAKRLTKGIITLVDNALLLLSNTDGLINLPSTHKNYTVVDKATVENERAPLLSSEAGGLINVPSAHKNYTVVKQATAEDIRALCNEILGQIGPLKKLNEESPIRWKDEAWKNLLLFVGTTVLITLGYSTAPLFIGGGALLLVYKIQLNYRKEIFDNVAKLLN